MSFAAGDHAGPGLQATPKIPPSFDGRSSWFSYEEAVDDWVDITTLEQQKLGPSLKHRLVGDAAVYKPLLDRDLLRDPNNGVRYFTDTVRPHFVKRQPKCLPVAFLPVPSFLPRPAGSPQMDRQTFCCPQASPRFVDGSSSTHQRPRPNVSKRSCGGQ